MIFNFSSVKDQSKLPKCSLVGGQTSDRESNVLFVTNLTLMISV